ncbi:hypothetical protein [Paractinoplanes rishiriensis]|uniref:hypothetical protein n=1 Tax=Paractinoplanes rishiriensis TaxID=1050105 RepID=UPI001942DC1F|nr:hypothetical protein [Actinoplanes rishiriensis]
MWAAVLLGAVSGLVLGVLAGVLVRIWPVLRALWWWSLEITASALLVAGWVTLAHAATWWLASMAVLLVAVVCTAVGPVRRFLVALSWCLLVRHRLRLCFTGIVRNATSGSGGSRPVPVPLLLWARPTPAGERVWLWLRPGLSLDDLEGKTARIAVACMAKQARVVAASERFAAFVRVDLGRRDALTGRIDLPLALLIPSLRNNNRTMPVSPALPPVGLELADIEVPPAPEPRGGRR